MTKVQFLKYKNLINQYEKGNWVEKWANGELWRVGSLNRKINWVTGKQI